MISREALEGPPAPALLRDSVGLSGGQLERYAQLYSHYTAETGPVRDSLRTSIQAMRAAFERDDRSEAGSRRDVVQRQSKALAVRDKAFEKQLEGLLSKEQEKQYEKWKDSREQARREHGRHLRRPASEGNL